MTAATPKKATAGSGAISAALADRINELVIHLLPAGRKEGSEWRVGSVAGEKGRSLGVQLRGDHRGLWHDRATGEGGDALHLVRAVHGGEMRDAIRWANDWLGSAPLPPPRPRIQEVQRPRPLDPTSLDLYGGKTLPITGSSVAGRYLARRGCALPPVGSDLRWHPDVLNWVDGSRWPAMVARITDAAMALPISLHFTFLARDGSGKAVGQKSKLYLRGHSKVGVCRLWPDDTVTSGLLIAEGIETALTAARGFAPTWACLDAGNMASFPPLAGIEALTIASDLDDAGQRAAESCAAAWRAAGREVRIWRAPAGAPKGADFDDFARAAA